MNPHHFLLTEGARSAGQSAVARPMDGMLVRDTSPQEDEFALMALGAPSPYAGLIVPSAFSRALSLADPDDLSVSDRADWEQVFMTFCRDVSRAHPGKRLVFKSPTHGYRVAALRRLMPDAKFVLITRDPGAVFESTVHMFGTMFALYGLSDAPPDDVLRRTVIEERLRYERKLAAGLAGIAPDALVRIRYEALADDPVGTVESIYRGLGLQGVENVAANLTPELKQRAGHRARAARPLPPWDEKVAQAWARIFADYGYEA
jgi:hypothetical protein